MNELEEKKARKRSMRALRIARRHLRHPDSKIARIMLAYQNAQEAGTTNWTLPER